MSKDSIHTFSFDFPLHDIIDRNLRVGSESFSVSFEIDQDSGTNQVFQVDFAHLLVNVELTVNSLILPMCKFDIDDPSSQIRCERAKLIFIVIL